MQGIQIETAVPRRRYRLGDFTVVVLGDVTSPDPVEYRHLAAFVPDGARDALLYVSCDRDAGGQGGGGWRLRVVAPHDARVLDTESDCTDLDAFAEVALAAGGRILELTDEEPRRLA